MWFLRFFVIFIVFGFTQSCKQSAPGPDVRILHSFTGFELVGKGPVRLDTDGSVDTLYVVDHDDTGQPMPGKLEIGTMYIFHSRIVTDVESMALEIIPENLSRLGFTIIEAPKSADDMLHPYVGGPIFHIRFLDANHEGLIFDQSHSTFEDFVLVYTR